MTRIPVSNSANDIHPFDPVKPGPVILGGIEIECDQGIKAHSDGDVVLHAIVDAILGILALPDKRDIGSLFPDNDPQWENADSKIFLKAVMDLAEEHSTDITHINVQIACKKPRLSEHYETMVQNIAAITGMPSKNINIQAMSNNGSGPEGRGEAISALATVNALRPADG